MKIAVMGCGAMGSIYAGLLAAAGHSVIAVDRNLPNVETINTHGLRVSGASGDRVTRITASVQSPQSVVDLLIIAVKGAGIVSAVANAEPLIGEQTTVLTMQNGLGSADIVADALGGERLIVGIAQGFGASRVAPGHVHHNDMKAIRMGAYSELPFVAVQSVSDVFKQAGFDAEAVIDITAMQWEKLICNVAYSAIAALTGMTVGAIMDDSIVGEVSRNAAIEAWDVAKALGVSINIEDPVKHVRDFASRMPDAKPSVLLDIENGRVSEVDIINGAIPKMAAKVGMSAPVNETLTRLVRSLEQRSLN